MRCYVLTLFSLIVMTPTVVPAQEVPHGPGPTKEHTWLNQFVGEWSTKSMAEMGPGQPAFECDGMISSRMLGSFWVLNEMTASMAGATVVGIQTVGYDPAKEKFVGTWVDSMANYMWHYEGTLDKTGKILTLEATGPNFMAGGKLTKFQDVYEFKSADEIAILSKMLGEDGKWLTFMTGTAKREKQGGESE